MVLRSQAQTHRAWRSSDSPSEGQGPRQQQVQCHSQTLTPLALSRRKPTSGQLLQLALHVVLDELERALEGPQLLHLDLQVPLLPEQLRQVVTPPLQVVLLRVGSNGCEDP
jgi:hypothetical protein